jgi:hypothetical protein
MRLPYCHEMGPETGRCAALQCSSPAEAPQSKAESGAAPSRHAPPDEVE